ncbi:MAG TPA: tRNA pseudouridine(38-40) synthase TruA [Anaerolineales bacterium]|nr:tRNA pseudouridine(38-40) synthase TruA [Anaerolineales bacterium]
MARYQLTIVYDGTDFFGSQRQARNAGSSGSRPRTVQGELEDALRSLGWTGRSILMAGRTDTGVHATGQVAAVDLDWSHPEDDLVRALNAALPADLAVHEARMVDAKFHPRFDAASRRYRYRLFCQPLRDPIRERYAWRVWPAPDGEVLPQVAKHFHGTHDFSAFGSPTAPKGTTVRTITRAEWMQTGEYEWHFEVQADAFLYRMVRRLVFVQVAVGQGKVSADAVAGSLAGQSRPESDRRLTAGNRSEKMPAGLAPAHGLTLVEVTYPTSESIGQ